MSVSDLVVGDAGTPGDYALDRHHVVRRGAWNAFVTPAAIAVVILLVQVPVYRVAAGWSTAGVDQTASVRLSLVLDTAFLVALALAALRAPSYVDSTQVHGANPERPRWTRWHLVGRLVDGTVRRTHRWPALMWLPSSWSAHRCRIARFFSRLVLVGVVLDVIENVVLACRHLAVAGEPEGEMQVLTLTWAKFVVLAVGLVLLLLTLVVAALHRAPRSRVPRGQESAAYAGVGSRAGTIICCSGGGIRAAAFAMGGLQALNARDIYSRAEAVVGVSGGGYVAAAHHVLRWSPADVSGHTDREWQGPRRRRLFALDSAELGWIRRHTRYLLGSFRVALQGSLALALGIAVNLLLVGSLLLVTSWTLGWYLAASGWADAAVRVAMGTLGTGIGCYLLRRIWERFHTPPEWAHRVLDRLCDVLVPLGGAALLALWGVPALRAELATDNPFWLPEAWAEALRSFAGVVPDGEGGAAASGAGAIVAAIVAALASLRGGSEEKAERWWTPLWTKVKGMVVPWVAALVVVVVLLALLLYWTGRALDDSAWIAPPGPLLWLGGLLLAARILTDANRTSLHHFFRWRISRAFLLRQAGGRLGPIPYERPLRFSEADPPVGQGPRLVTCAVANVTDEDLVPADRDCVPFVFGHDLIGVSDRMLPPRASMLPSAAYERAADPSHRDATIPAALAMSAAAFSPLAGRENRLLGPYRLVLALANARLGVWLPNPLYVDAPRTIRALVRSGEVQHAAELLTRFGHRRGRALDGPAWNMRLLDDTLLHALSPVAEAVRSLDAALRLRVAFQQRHASATRELLRLDCWPLRFTVGERARTEHAVASTVELVERSSRLVGALRARLTERVEAVSGSSLKRGTWISDVLEGLRKPGLTRVFKEAVGKASIYDRYLYVTDGGHYDNTGLVEALRRRAAEVYVLDASNDDEDEFSAIGRAIATARMDLDCRVELDPRVMLKQKDGPATAAWCSGTATYADGSTGTVHVVKAIMLNDLAWDVEAYALENGTFPRSSTLDQMYSEFDFEAYRALGHHATSKLLVGLPQT